MKRLPLGLKIILTVNLLWSSLSILSNVSTKTLIEDFCSVPFIYLIGTPLLANLGFIYKKFWAPWVAIIYSMHLLFVFLFFNPYQKDFLQNWEEICLNILGVGYLLWSITYLLNKKRKLAAAS